MPNQASTQSSDDVQLLSISDVGRLMKVKSPATASRLMSDSGKPFKVRRRKYVFADSFEAWLRGKEGADD